MDRLRPQLLQRAGWTAAGTFKKSEIRCRTGKASFVLRAWIGNSRGARVMSRRAGTAEAEIKALIEAWADAVRRHDVPAILAHHDDDMVMFDVPPPLQSRGMAAYKKTWDLFFAYHQPGQAFDVEELQICVGDPVAFAVAIMRCGSATLSGPPVPGGFQFRLTIGLCKVEGAWCIQHEHHSVPATD